MWENSNFDANFGSDDDAFGQFDTSINERSSLFSKHDSEILSDQQSSRSISKNSSIDHGQQFAHLNNERCWSSISKNEERDVGEKISSTVSIVEEKKPEEHDVDEKCSSSLSIVQQKSLRYILRSIGLIKFFDSFTEKDIDIESLLLLNINGMTDLGMNAHDRANLTKWQEQYNNDKKLFVQAQKEQIDALEIKVDSDIQTLQSMRELLFQIGGDREKGIFTIHPKDEDLQQTLQKYKAGNITISASSDPHVISSCIKEWFSNIGFDSLTSSSQNKSQNGGDKNLAIRKRILASVDVQKVLQVRSIKDAEKLLETLSDHDRNILHWLVDMCADIAINNSVNKMGPKNLAIAFTPHLFDFDESCKPEDQILLYHISPVILNFLISKRLDEKSKIAANSKSVHLVINNSSGLIDSNHAKDQISKPPSELHNTEIMKYENGTYSGEIKILKCGDVQKHGKGVFIDNDGTKFEGYYKDDHKVKGLMTFTSGRKYFGRFREEIFHGYGILTMINGNQYAGQIDAGVKEGFGTYMFADGRTYSGGFKNDQYDGDGTFSYLNGSRCIGRFKNGLKHGVFKMILEDGSTQKAKWEKNKFIK